MKLSTTVEHKFRRTPDGSVWSLSQFPYDHWSKYLRVFDHVRVIARVLDVPEPEPACTQETATFTVHLPLQLYGAPKSYDWPKKLSCTL